MLKPYAKTHFSNAGYDGYYHPPKIRLWVIDGWWERGIKAERIKRAELKGVPPHLVGY